MEKLSGDISCIHSSSQTYWLQPCIWQPKDYTLEPYYAGDNDGLLFHMRSFNLGGFGESVHVVRAPHLEEPLPQGHSADSRSAGGC